MDRRTFVKSLGVAGAVVLLPVAEAKAATNLYVPLPNMAKFRTILRSADGSYRMWLHPTERYITRETLDLLRSERHRGRNLHFVGSAADKKEWCNFVAEKFRILGYVEDGPTRGDKYVYDIPVEIVFTDVHICMDKFGLYISAPGERCQPMLDAGIRYPGQSQVRYPISKVVDGVDCWLGQWKIRSSFEDQELRAYVEMSLDWVNGHLEHEDGRQVAELVDGEIVTEMDGEMLEWWLEAVHWGALVHATFALTLNWDETMHANPQLRGRLEDTRGFKGEAELAFDASLQKFMHEAECRYEIATLDS